MKFAVYQEVTEEYKRESVEGRAPTYGKDEHQIRVGKLRDSVGEALKDLLALKAEAEVILPSDNYDGHGHIKLQGLRASYGDKGMRCGNHSTLIYGSFHIGIVDADKKERAYRAAPDVRKQLLELWGFKPL